MNHDDEVVRNPRSQRMNNALRSARAVEDLL